MRRPLPVRAAALPATSRLDRSASLVCLALALALVMLAARILTLW